ncbi:MAG TPA: DEAD/DEAH box helicase [Candidatus Sulfotelmatobacter sp.]|nr:DEAD/DEAH box helicase [Candidatus Sulfotelmatobacter sp.]
MQLPPSSLGWAHPLVAEWFVSRFGTPTEPQEQGWPHILAGRATLISAPTGSGKTLAAFLACIDRLVRKALAGELRDRTEVLYVSPLKALGNDIQKNLEIPLGEILALAGERGLLMPEIRTAVRTGDTLMPERRAMLKRPPHILVTTPESLYILLTSERSRAVLRDVETVIVDEIHAVADDKRGAHLSLSLERLEALTYRRPVRIGLSATQKPIEEVAHFLTGTGRHDPIVVDVGHKRKLDLGIEVPPMPLGPVASNEMWDTIYDRLVELVGQHRSTLVFVNTRRMAERIAHELGERMGEENVAAHHGSLSRKLRLAAERKLKEGQVRVLVATASLELGIDVGFVDLVVQVNSPRAISVALQRVGRSGHWRGAVPKGRFFATTRDDLNECAALVRAIKLGDLDRLIIPEAPLDVLAQQIVAACAAAGPKAPRRGLKQESGTGASAEARVASVSVDAGSKSPLLAKPARSEAPQSNELPEADRPALHSSDGWDEDELLALVTRAYPYRNLRRETFDSILEMLSEGIAARRGRYGAYIHRDRVNKRLRARRGARLAAITSGGAIPDNSLYTVVAEPDGAIVGTVDEDFAVESNRGDIMLLGNSSWIIHRIETNNGRMLVHDAHGAPPSVPFWRGEAPARTEELSSHVGELRQKISDMLPRTSPVGFSATQPEVAACVSWLKNECGLDDSGAEQMTEYILQGRVVLGAVPTRTTVIAERFFDEGGGMQLVIHAPFGGRINKAWGLSLRKRFCRGFNFELQAAATDNGLNIALAEQHSFPLGDVFHFLNAETVQPILEQAALDSPIFGTRWRWDANRALALLRFQNGKKVPAQIQRMRSDDLLASVFPDAAACFENIEGERQIPDHPLVGEVMKDVLTEAMDVEGLKRVLRGMASGEIRVVAVDTPVPSQFSHEILNANPYAYLDDAPLEERRARAVEMRRVLPESVLEEVGGLDPGAIAQVRSEAWPDVRDADELHDVLHTLVALPETFDGVRSHVWQNQRDMGLSSWPLYFEQLEAQGRAGIASFDERRYWVAEERVRTFRALFPSARFETDLTEIETGDFSRDDALLTLVMGWMSAIGPTTASRLGDSLGLPASDIEKGLLRMEAAGTVLRGKFTSGCREVPAAPGQPLRPPSVQAQAAVPTPSSQEAEIEWCERRLLARIHRLTVGMLRKQIEPVTAAQFMRWLLRWQHVAPGSQAAGERGTLEVLQQLQGFEIPANAWERQVLARRVTDYDPKGLDQLCLTGAVGWGRLSPHPATLESGGASDGTSPRQRRVIPTSVAPITFFVREEADWMGLRPNPHLLQNRPELGHPASDIAQDSSEPSRGLGHGAQLVLEFLKQRGASFFADIVRGTGKLKAEIETALWELVAGGLVTADGFDNLRSLIDPKRRAGQGSGRALRPRHSAGRWARLHADAAVERPRAIEAACWMLLRRYGVVIRDLLARESNLPTWRELLMAFRRLEDRGEIRGGRFVDGFLGEQFALPVAVESVRAMRSLPLSGEMITLSAADPLNLVGILVPGERVPAISGRTVSYRDGVAVEQAPGISSGAVAG